MAKPAEAEQVKTAAAKSEPVLPEPCKSCGATVYELRRFCVIENGKARLFGLEAQCVGCGLKRVGMLA